MLHTIPCQAVIFDLDGTLIDSSPSILECFGLVLKSAGLQACLPLSDSLIGPPLRQTLINLTGLTDTTVLDKLVESFKAIYDTEGFKATRVYDGVEALLEYLSEKSIPLAIATNKRRIPTLKIIEHLGWGKYFCTVGTLDTPTPPHSDKAALIRFVLSEMEIAGEKTLYVGDKWEDGEAATANGMAFCAAEWGYGEWNPGQLQQHWSLSNSPCSLKVQISQEPNTTKIGFCHELHE
jgi:phosphoglycolate phosphatase